MSRRLRPTVEFITNGWVLPGDGGRVAAESEALGFDVQGFGVNECLTADVFAELRLAAAATETIGLMTSVANFVTRRPVVVAGGCAALDMVSGGRATCGIGKGDSAVAMLGLSPQRHDDYVRDVGMLRRYLAGQTVEVDGAHSSLSWLPPGRSPVEVEMFASGPRSIEAAARLADRITLSVGIGTDRIQWALDIIERTLADCGRQRRDVRVGACVPFVIHEDAAEAEQMLRPLVLGWAHMSSFPGMDLDQQPEILRQVTTATRARYSYEFHNTADVSRNPLASEVDPGFVNWFGVGGEPATVARRLVDLYELGIQHFLIASTAQQSRRWALEVAPLVRSAVA